MLQTPEEWQTRNRVLASTLRELLDRHPPRSGEGRALDVGCQDATLTAIWAEETDLQWWGVDPALSEPTSGPHGIELDE